MKKWLRYILRTGAGLLCLLLLGWLLLASFVILKKDSLLQKARTEVRNRLGGEITIGDLDVAFFRHFPNITIQLNKVSLRDSLWSQHHHDLVQADNIYLNMSLVRSLWSAKVTIGRVYLEHGTVWLYTDSTGYTNTYLFHPRKQTRSGKEANPPDLSLNDMRLVMERQDKRKFFDLEVRQIECHIDKKDRMLSLNIRTHLQVKSLAFNTDKGSFVKNKPLSGRFTLQYNTASKIIQFKDAAINIGGYPFYATGRFFPSVHPDPFFLVLSADRIPFREVTSLLTPNIQQKLDQYDIDQPIAVRAQLDAGAADDPTPQINVQVNLVNGSVLTPIGRFTKTTFRASFINEQVRGEKRGDENSAIRLLGFSGNFENIPLSAGSVVITDLKRPHLATGLQSTFDMSRLNKLLGSQTFQFTRGSGRVDLFYDGPLSANDSAAATLNGSITLDSTTLQYLPSSFQLTGCSGKIRFKNQDMILDHLEARAGKSRLVVKGVARNLSQLLNQDASDVSMDWTLSSAHLDLNDLISLAGRQTATVSPQNKNTSLFATSTGRLDRLLRSGVVHLRLEAADLVYQKFAGARARADLVFEGEEIRLTGMDISQGSGSVHLEGSLQRQGTRNPLTLHAHFNQVDLPKLFTQFDDFGQNALEARNLRGRLTADARMTGTLTDKAAIVPGSMKGTVNFSVMGGQLLDFEPMQKVHETVLKKRDLSAVRFGELSSQLDLDTTTIYIHRMEIQSTAFTLFVEGVYDRKTGPDLSLQVPLSNLKERSPDAPPPNKGNEGKAGLSLRLRAKRGDDGKLKITWDPFKKALKKKKG